MEMDEWENGCSDGQYDCLAFLDSNFNFIGDGIDWAPYSGEDMPHGAEYVYEYNRAKDDR